MSAYADLLNFVPWLRAHAPVKISEVSNHFDWTSEQVVQYVLLAGVSGFGEMHGELFDVTLEGEYIYVMDSLGLDRPFRLDQVEAACVVLGLDLMSTFPALYPNISEATIASVKSKVIEASNQVPQVQVVAADQVSITDEIESAISESRRLQFNYWNEATGMNQTRQVSPIRLVLTGGLVRLEGWCHTKNGWRTFILKRISDLQVLDQTGEIPDDGFQTMPAVSVTVELPLNLKYQLENMVVESVSRPKGEKISAVIKVLEPAWLGRQIISTGCQIKVLEPAKFRNKVNEFIDSARKVYE